SDGSATTAEDTPLSGNVSATDVDGDTLTYAVVAGPSNGSLTLNPNGSFTYTPAANYNGGDSFNFRASDGSLTSNTATVSLTITPVNDAPVASNASATVAEDTALSGTVSGTDVDGDVLTYAVVNGPAHGTLTLNATGSFAYAPAANYNGPDSFTFR